MKTSRAIRLKRGIRSCIRAQRQHQSIDRARHASCLIQNRLVALPEYHWSSTIFLYLARDEEVSLDRLLVWCLRDGKCVLVPAWNARRKTYGLRQISERTRFECRRFGVREPTAGRWVDFNRVDTVIVPGVAFDLLGGRIGHGGGYYDRLLAAMPTARRIGVSFGFQVCSRLPQEPWDELMDVLLTDAGTTRFRKQRAALRPLAQR